MLTLSVTRREKTGKGVRSLRRDGSIPAVVYGAHKESTPITLPERDFDRIFKEAGESTVVNLTGLGEDIPSLIHDIDRDPVKGTTRHVDFYAITKGEKVEIEIPIEFVGESSAVKAGANLVKVLHEIEIEADPMILPQYLSVDISSLVEIGDQIHVRDLTIPEGVEVLTDADEVVALIQEIVEEKEEEVPADLSEIEVEKKGKEEEAGEVAAETPKEESKEA
jgi:large subunit ribosomal protein L25